MNPIRADGQRRVDRQIGCPGFEHRQDRDDRLGRPRKQQRHTTDPGPRRDRPADAPTGWRPRRVRGRSSSGPRRLTATASGVPRDLRGEQRRNRHRRSPAGSTPRGYRTHPGGRARRHRADPPTTTGRVGIGGHGHQHPLQPPDQRVDARRVEHVGVVFDAQAAARAPGMACTVSG